MAGHKALGRGLDALFGGGNAARPKAETAVAAARTTETVETSAMREIAVELIQPNRHQPRTQFDPAALQELSDSIKQHGLAQPLLVTELEGGRYELVAGERRLRAAKLAGLTHVPCTVKKYSNRERFEVALIENIQRQDLNALEEAVAFNAIMVEYNLTQDQLAAGLGKSRSSIANSLRLLRLHDDVQAAVRGGLLSEGHAKCLAGVADQDEQLKWMRRIIDEKLSVRDLENFLSETKIAKGAGLKKAAAKNRSAEILRYEEEFQRALGRRVEIQSTGQKGWLRFAFYSPSDLDLLCRQLGLINTKNEKEFN